MCNLLLEKEMMTSGSGSTSAVTQRTNVHLASAKLEWQIAKFDTLMKFWSNGKEIVSQRFGASTVPDIFWELHVYPNGKEASNVNCVSLALYLQQVDKKKRKEPISTKLLIYCSAPSTQITHKVI